MGAVQYEKIFYGKILIFIYIYQLLILILFFLLPHHLWYKAKIT